MEVQIITLVRILFGAIILLLTILLITILISQVKEIIQKRRRCIDCANSQIEGGGSPVDSYWKCTLIAKREWEYFGATQIALGCGTGGRVDIEAETNCKEFKRNNRTQAYKEFCIRQDAERYFSGFLLGNIIRTIEAYILPIPKEYKKKEEIKCKD